MLSSSVGVFLTWMLSLSHSLSRSLPCNDDSGCDVVASSPYSRVAGIPVAYFGLAAFVAILILIALFSSSGQDRYLRSATILAALASVVNLALSAVASILLRAHCWWCLGANLAYVITTIFLVAGQPKSSIHPGSMLRGGFVKITVFVTFFSIGLGSKALTASTNRMRWDVGALMTTDRNSLLEGAMVIATGPKEGRDVALIFIDMRCEACHEMISKVLRRPQKLRVFVRHYPLPSHDGSKELAALAVLAEREGHGPAFLAQTLLPEIGELKAYRDLARRLKVRLDDPEMNREAQEVVERDLNLAKRLGLRSTPTVVLMQNDKMPVFLSERDFLLRYGF